MSDVPTHDPVAEVERPAEVEPAVPDNWIRLRGRVSVDPSERVLPSGDRLWLLRLVVPRPPASAAVSSQRLGDGATARAVRRQSVDVVDCAVWSGRIRSQVARWQAGDQVEVEGALRRRFFRGAGGTASRFEVEVSRGRRLRRAGSA